MTDYSITPTGSGPAPLGHEPAPFVMTPDVIMAMVQHNLREMDAQLGTIIQQIEGNRLDADALGRKANGLRDFIQDLRACDDITDGDGKISLDKLNDDCASDLRRAIGLGTREDLLALVQDDPGLLAKVQGLPAGEIGDFGGTFNDDDTEKLFAKLVKSRFDVDISSTADSMNIQVFDDALDTVTENQRLANSNSEMLMVQLQSRMQQRSQIIQLGSNMLKSVDDGISSIIGNMR